MKTKNKNLYLALFGSLAIVSCSSDDILSSQNAHSNLVTSSEDAQYYIKEDSSKQLSNGYTKLKEDDGSGGQDGGGPEGGGGGFNGSPGVNGPSKDSSSKGSFGDPFNVPGGTNMNGVDKDKGYYPPKNGGPSGGVPSDKPKETVKKGTPGGLPNHNFEKKGEEDEPVY
ncbi:hypothetical protein [Myroides guanonis]|uniref:Lipoprotein n=1 Tax=Myroides guanonis TaxID=1150112 RepID=A0A1I3R364_9FLAO|nr:hypothetical protein [Myroides guanonis]SFJ40994.1 hypothetical protein SAMN04487893_10741 [Myroides guanonis]